MLLFPSNAATTGDHQLLLHLVTTGDSTLGLGKTQEEFKPFGNCQSLLMQQPRATALLGEVKA